VAKKIRENIGERRIGIALPAGAGAHIANIAVLLANKTSVNLNFTLGHSTIESAIEQAGIKTVLTASAICEKFRQFPWPKNILDISKIVSGLGKFQILKLIAEICITPTRVLARRYNVPTIGGDNEATVLFSSGTTGKPKGVVLSHKNIISNCLQIWITGILNKNDSILASLPIFHSFGMTINLWFCLLFGIRTATYPNPMEVKKISAIIEKEKLTGNLSTPTFFRQYIGKVAPKQLRSLRASVAGGERVTLDIIDSWVKTFQTEMIAGYGLTEASPVVSLNFPLSSKVNSRGNSKKGSIGRVLPGISVKFIGPETGKPMPLGETGILCLRGPNVFCGYVDDGESTAKALRDGWLVTGDLARLDADGFLHIDGRVSRFSKIGGEMVPHVGIEEAISKVLSLTHSNGPEIAVLSRIDRKKGEGLVLLSEHELDMRTLREKLLRCGISALWIPREYVLVEDIPSLETGKLDLNACKQLVESKLSECHP
jgi:acyl-[acyl-carrier-protein]-phospholipid O-acyltransferase/long-chain-fatty-acid--[acyl-carrier-protein] ligase